MVYNDDTPLTNEMLGVLCDKPPHDRGFVIERGFEVPKSEDVRFTTWLGIFTDFGFGVETNKDFISLGRLKTLGHLRKICHVLNITLDETRLVRLFLSNLQSRLV